MATQQAALKMEVEPVSKKGIDRGRYITDVLIQKTPTTDIIKRIKEATKNKDIILSVLVDKEMAEDMMTLNHGNRHMRVDTVDAYTKLMKEGRWLPCVNMIAFSDEPRLINGQHCLMAVIMSDTKQVFHIQTGFERDAFSVMDAGRNRTAGDALSVLNVNDANVLAAAVKSVIYFTKYNKVAASVTRQRVTNQDVVDWVNVKKNISLMEQCVQKATTDFRRAGPFLSNSTWAFIYFLAMRIHTEDAAFFFYHLSTGKDISDTKNKSIYLLREMLLRMVKNVHDPIGKRSTELKVRYFIFSWNAFRNKRVNPRYEIKDKININKEVNAPFEKMI